MHKPTETPNFTLLLQVFREWREVQCQIRVVPEYSGAFFGALRREEMLGEYICRYCAETGLEWDIQWFVRATNGLAEINDGRFRSLSLQFNTLFGKVDHDDEAKAEKQSFDPTICEGRDALALVLLGRC